jgi:hypothetical protein
MQTIDLSVEQQVALTAILNFVEESNYSDDDIPDAFVLKGYAGTGKSLTMAIAIEAIQALRPTWKICFAAPTHKALGVLKGYCESNGIRDCFFSTIHSLLGLEVSESEGKKRTGRFKLNTDEPIWLFNLVILDECSMIGTEIWDNLNGIINSPQSHPKLICMGDPAQLPPIGEALSLTFDIPRTAMLSEVRRYSGVTARLVEDIRQNLDRAVPRHYRYETEDNLVICEKNHWTSLLLHSFEHGYDDQNPDKIRALAWTNKTVNWLNGEIRKRLYNGWLPEEMPEFCKDERVVASSTFSPNGQTRVYSSTEGIVRNIETVIKTFPFDGLEKKFNTTVMNFEVNEIEIEFPAIDKTFVVPRIVGATEYKTPPNYERYCEVLAYLKRSGSQTKEATRRKAVWRAYYNLLAWDMPVRPLYALTVHNSQGSSFGDVFLASLDCEKNQDVVERNKLLYVGASRARNKLYMCV